MRILLIEDDEALGEGLRSGLRQLGFAVDWLRDGLSADAALSTEHFDAVDLGLPRLGGLEVLRRLRARGDRTAVLVLTAHEALDERIEGLDLGGDDYVVKPVAVAELAARLRALVRRSGGVASARFTVGELTLDAASRRVEFRGQPVELKAREFDVLEALMLSAGRVLTKEQLESRLYEWDRTVESNTLEVYIHHLRRKLAPEVIRTVRGVGYLLPRPPAAAAGG
ncbi:MAG: winged helix-turn-helix domain-containing protein [Proteobacteria bacterium]|nr:winged helix-turn-helix domain-containing protein [Pseudomonadota bacterium]